MKIKLRNTGLVLEVEACVVYLPVAYWMPS